MNSAPKNDSALFCPLEQLGLADELVANLNKLGLHRSVDLLFHFPRDYEIPAAIVAPEDFSVGETVAFTGTVYDTDQRWTQHGKHILGALITPDAPTIDSNSKRPAKQVRLVWFNQPFRRGLLQKGTRIRASGKLKSSGLNWEIVQPNFEVIEHEHEVEHPADDEPARPLPIYPLTGGIKQAGMRRTMKRCLPGLIDVMDEALPNDVRSRLSIPDIADALNATHFPATIDEAQNALRRFKLQELLVLQLAIAMQRRSRESSADAPQIETNGKTHARILNRLPYELTADQAAAVDDLRNDMQHSIPMNRLLQGDVGSGKTLVAEYAMLATVANNLQAALLVPTELLAQQHMRSFSDSLKSSRVRIALLTGKLSKSERDELYAQVANHEIDLLIGTQALLNPRLQFAALGLVVVDEQHKFGVQQRAQLRSGKSSPHCLVLSATPIPRTIAMTYFGDLDASIIRSKPPGRATLHSYSLKDAELERWWKFVDKEIRSGAQAYIIAPRIGKQSQAEPDLATAKDVYKELIQGPLKSHSLGILHGQLSADEKEAVLLDFAHGTIDALVATTVVEVGIDVPNATTITILDADRLGLSQLHQLRGRVGRGKKSGYAAVIASKRSDTKEHERLDAFAKCSDGFELADLDLRLRGPGDLLGTDQSGLPTLRLANLVEDGALVDLAKAEAQRIIANDPELSDPSLARLVQQTLRRYGKSMQLGDIG